MGGPNGEGGTLSGTTALVEAGGIPTRYQVVGSGPPVLFLAPGGFDATIENWSSLGKYRELQLVRHVAEQHTCILFDRREAGGSGGVVERLTWRRYADQALGLLDHLGVGRADVLGGCAGCSVVLALMAAAPARVRRAVLYWPAGGAKYRMSQQARLARHLAYVEDEGLDGVVVLARQTDRRFSEDPRVGPWAAPLRADPGFAERFSAIDPVRYRAVVAGTARTLFDRDTVPGAEPEDLLTLDLPSLVVPGRDDSHATSAARYLEECLPGSSYLDVRVEEQSEERVAAAVLGFLATGTDQS